MLSFSLKPGKLAESVYIHIQYSVQTECMSVYRKNLVVNLLAYLQQREADLNEICRRAAVELDTIKQNKGPALSDQQFNDLWKHAVDVSNDPLLGLHLGESMSLAALGVIGDIVRNSPTIGDAVANAATFLSLVTDLFAMNIVHKGKNVSLLLEPVPARAAQYPDALRHMLDLAMVFTLHEVDGLVLAKVSPQSITLPPHALSHRAEYSRILRCKPQKLSGMSCLVFDAAFWYEPIVLADYNLQRELISNAQAMLNNTDSDGSNRSRSFSANITAWLTGNAYLGIPSLEQLAANFNTSTRSLQRRLHEEGVTYQQLADNLRQTLALRYLRTGQYAVKEVAYMLGYNELSAFTRAFRRWTGISPAKFKANNISPR